MPPQEQPGSVLDSTAPKPQSHEAIITKAVQQYATIRAAGTPQEILQAKLDLYKVYKNAGMLEEAQKTLEEAEDYESTQLFQDAHQEKLEAIIGQAPKNPQKLADAAVSSERWN